MRVHLSVCVCVFVCECVCVCIALLGYVWHGDHRTLIVAQDQVRACTSVNVRVRGFVGLCVTCPLQPRAVKQGKEHVHAHVLLCVPVCYVPFLCTR